MSEYILYTYRGLPELRRIQNERKVYRFVFQDTLSNLEQNDEICIDISALTYYLLAKNNDIYPAYMNLSAITEKTIIIVDEKIANAALEIFSLVFSSYKEYYKKEEKTDGETDAPLLVQNIQRRTIYKYNNAKELDKIIDYANKTDIPIATFQQANQDRHDEFEKFCKSEKIALLDATSMTYAVQDNKSIIYVFEQLICLLNNVSVICLTVQVDKLLDYFPLFFNDVKPIGHLIPELKNIGQEELSEEALTKITDFNTSEFNDFIDKFSHNLVGHFYFKERLQYLLWNFIKLNKAREQKVFSIFLFGASGIGKTEVARLIANGLKDNSYLAKINFQNYSSQDALNSLIGSPAGYVGCNHGELSEKVQKSKVAVLLCDEFEKTTRPVYSFFLELLEEGRFTDSMAREYDMDGYIIVFTSNITGDNEYKKLIPPELQTRFDLVCEFEQPTVSDKKGFLVLLLEKAQTKFKDMFDNSSITDVDKKELLNFNYSQLLSLRDIKRVFNNRLMDLFSSKENSDK